MPRMLGDAFVTVSPLVDQATFRALTDADVRKAIAGINPQVKIGADTTGVLKAVTDMQGKMAALSKTMAELRIGADTAGAEAKIVALQAKLAALARTVGEIIMKADTTQLDKQIADETAKLATLRRQASQIQLDADAAKLTLKIETAQALVDKLNKQLRDGKLDMSDDLFLAKLYNAEGQLAALKNSAAKTELDAKTDKLNQAISASIARLAALKAEARNLQLGDAIDLAKLTDASKVLLEIEDAVNKINAALTMADTGPPSEALVKLRDQGAELAAVLGDIHINADDKDMQAKLDSLRLQAVKLNESLKDVNVGIDPVKMATAIAQTSALDNNITKFRDDLIALGSGPVFGPVTEKLSDLQARAEALTMALHDIQVKGDDTDLKAKIAQDLLGAYKLQDALKDVTIGGDPGKMLAYSAAIASAEASLAKLGSTGTKTAASPIFTGGWIGGQIMGFNTLHLVLDALVEGIIIAATSALALGAGFAVAYPAIDQVGYATKNALNAMTALGVDAGPLAGKLDAVQKAMAPQVIEAYGGLLNILTGQTGALSKAGSEVVTMFDDWIARIDIYMQHQNGMDGLMKSGISFLEQMAKIIGTLAEAIDNLLTKDPGVAKFLLMWVQGVADLINIFSKLPAPLVEATLALHGFYLWTKVLVVGPILAMAQAMGLMSAETAGAVKSALSFKSAMTFFLTNPFGPWVAGAIILAAAIGIMIYEWHQASDVAKKAIGDMNDALASDKASTAILQISTDIGELNNSIRTAFGPSNIEAIQKTFGAWGTPSMGNFKANMIGIAGTAVSFGNALKDAFTGKGSAALHDLGNAWDFMFNTKHADAIHQAGNDIRAYNSEIVSLTSEQTNLFKETGSLINQGYTYNQALGLMDMAGVKASDSFELMHQKVENLISGYQDMSIQSGILANSVNALNFQTEQQDSKVTQLNAAWDNFFKTVTGSGSGFVSFAQQMNGLTTNLAGTNSTLTDSNGKVSNSLKASAAAAAGGSASMTGLNNASLGLRSTFLQTADAANSQVDALTLQASAAGLGAKGTGMLTQSVKDMVTQMLPAAKGSQEMTSVLYALAQRGGYQGADSFQALSKWVGNTRDPMANLDKITTTLTTDSANLTKDVQNLSVALGTNLNDAMAAAILQASGGQKVYNDFANAVTKTGMDSKATRDAAVPLEESLLKMTGSATDAKKEFETFAQEGLGKTKAQADALWQETFPGVQKAADTTKGKVGDLAGTLGKMAGQKYVFQLQADMKKASDDIASLQQQLTKTTDPTKRHKIMVEIVVQSEIKKTEGDLANLQKQLDNTTDPKKRRAIEMEIKYDKAKLDDFEGQQKKLQGQAGLWQKVWGDVSRWGSDAWKPIAGVARSAFGGIQDAWSHVWGAIPAPVKNAFDDVKRAITSGFDGWWKTHGDEVKQVWGTVVDYFKNRWNEFWGTAKEVGHLFDVWWTNFTGGLKGAWDFMVGSFKTSWHELQKSFDVMAPVRKAVFSGLVDVFDSVAADIESAAKVMWDTVALGGKLIWNSVKAAAKLAWDTIVVIVDVALDVITGHWGRAWDDIKNYGIQVINIFKNMFVGAWHDIESYGQAAWGNIWGTFWRTIGAPLSTFFTNTIPGWAKAIGGFFATAWSAVWHGFDSAIIEPLVNFFTRTIPKWLWGSSLTTDFAKAWLMVWNSFYSLIVGNLINFFTKMIPGWLAAVAKLFTNLATNAWHDFNSYYLQPALTFWTKTVPGWLADAGKWLSNLAVNAWHDFLTYYVDPELNFWTKTVPGWLGDVQKWLTNLASQAWHDFLTYYVDPQLNFWTNTVPGWIASLGKTILGLWDTVINYFSQHVDKPLSTAISNWSNDITNAFKSGWDSVAQWFNNNIINWINNNILHHLPGNLSIGHIPVFATGGDVPGSGHGDTVPAMLTPGEFVVRKPAVAAMEAAVPGIMTQLNQAEKWVGTMGFAGGGQVFAVGGPVLPGHPAPALPAALTPPGNPTRAPAVDPRDAPGGKWVHVPGRGDAPYDMHMPKHVPGFASGGAVEQSMLNYMLSKKGDAYSEANRWGRPPYDCSSLVWSAANAAGVPIPQSEAIAASEAEWFSKFSNDYTYTSSGEIQTGDILFFTGAAPGPTQWGGVGHTGMAASPNVLISALGTQYGVTESAIGGDFVVGTRLGGKGGKSILSKIWGGITGFFTQMWQSAEGLLNSAGDGLGSLISPIAGFIQGGAKELLNLAKLGAKPIFDFVWDHTVNPLLKTIPGDQIPGGMMLDVAGKIKTGIDSFLGNQDSQAQAQANAANASAGGSANPGLMTVAQYVLSHGGNKAAAAGVAGTVAGESNGDPEARQAGGGGGAGLIQWTPESSAFPLKPIITGNPQKDMGTQLVDMMAYIASRGGIGSINAAGSSAAGVAGAQAAARVFSQMEAPAVPGSDIRPGVVSDIFSKLASGGVITEPIVGLGASGKGYLLGEAGPETVVPGVHPEHLASGGLAGYQQKLGGDQYAEILDYDAFRKAALYALATAKSGSAVSSYHTSIVNELGTLATRQANEAAAYKPVMGAHVTAAQISHFITMLKDEETTTKDIGLGKVPGGTLATLRAKLAVMQTQAAQEPALPGGTTGGTSPFWDWKTPTGTIDVAQFWAQLKSGQVTEKATYAAIVNKFKGSLASAKPGAWDYVHRATISSELQTLAQKQNAEISAYTALLKTYGTTGNMPGKSQLSAYLSALKSMASTVKDADLSHVPGGWPTQMLNMYADLGGLYQMAGKTIGNAATPTFSLTAPGLPKKGTPEYITLAGIYGWYDNGGWLPPGVSIAENRTGQPEKVLPPGQSGGASPGEQAIIARLDRLINLAVTAPAAYSAALSGVAGRSAARGYYGTG